MERRAKVLFIDDDENNRNSFKAAFRNHYEILVADSALSAMGVLREHRVNVIITDQRMPTTTGVEFLESIIFEYPNPIRILVIGYEDKEVIIDAINRGEIYRYVTKPWDEREFKMVIDHAYELYLTKALLKEKTLQLEKASQELDHFAYSASHDLRSPLTTIQGVIRLAKTEPALKDNEYLRMIETSVNRLDMFTQNIINYYKNSRQAKQNTPIFFETMVKDIMDNFRLFQHIDDIGFKINIDQQESFKSDEFRIRMILNNLLSNAIKYKNKTKQNKFIDVNIAVKGGVANIKVKDNGIGIAPTHLNNIFNMFYRATGEGMGSGLGLYIVKEAITKLNGEINVESAPDEGTVFAIKIPSMK